MHPREMPYTATLLKALIASDLEAIEDLLMLELVDEASRRWDQLAKNIATKRYLFGDHKIAPVELEPEVSEVFRMLEANGHVGLAQRALETNNRLVSAQEKMNSHEFSESLYHAATRVASSSH